MNPKYFLDLVLTNSVQISICTNLGKMLISEKAAPGPAAAADRASRLALAPSCSEVLGQGRGFL